MPEQRAKSLIRNVDLPFECSPPASDKWDPVDVMLPWHQTGYTSCGKEQAKTMRREANSLPALPWVEKKVAEFFCFREMFLYNEEKATSIVESIGGVRGVCVCGGGGQEQISTFFIKIKDSSRLHDILKLVIQIKAVFWGECFQHQWTWLDLKYTF